MRKGMKGILTVVLTAALVVALMATIPAAANDASAATGSVVAHDHAHDHYHFHCHRACNHTHTVVWEWEVYPTESSDGTMICRCTGCGEVLKREVIANSAYLLFNLDAVDAIKAAKGGSTVTIDAKTFNAFHQMVYDAMRARPDVNVTIVNYRQSGVRYTLTVLGGADLSKLPGGAAYEKKGKADGECAGFLYLASCVGAAVTQM